MRHGIVLFASDRGITPAEGAKAAEERGFDAFYVPEHSHIPLKRQAAHPRTGDATLPDDRYLRTLDPWVSPGHRRRRVRVEYRRTRRPRRSGRKAADRAARVRGGDARAVDPGRGGL